MLPTGSKAPAFVLPDVTGSQKSLKTLLSGARPVLLAFFKVTCPTCQLTLPYLERIQQQGVLDVYGISQNNAADTGEFARYYKLSYPMLLDNGRTYPVSNAYGITHVPSMFLIDTNQEITWSSHGFSKPYLEEVGRIVGFSVFRESDKVPQWKPG
jgi:peroxiredoxin